MSRVVATAVLCAAFALLIGGNRSLSARNVLVREAATILPAGTRILDSEYRDQCLGALKIPSRPCLSLRFRFPGDAPDRLKTIVERTGDRWDVVPKRYYSGWSVTFRHGHGDSQVRASAGILDAAYVRRCHEPALVQGSCEDYLRLELGRPAPPLKVNLQPVYGTVDEGAVPRRNARPLLVQTTGG